jgi:predicted ATP-dependent endonuclease of OLD family
MEKITIKGFGPIKDAEIEVKKLLVLIGEQASGKSTIAKLIYFFKSLPDEFFKTYYLETNIPPNIEDQLQGTINRLFSDYFARTYWIHAFEITYYFDNERIIKLSRNESFRIEVNISEKIISGVEEALSQNTGSRLKEVREKSLIEKDFRIRLDLNQQDRFLIQQFGELLDKSFNKKYKSKLYFLAGREAIVSFQDTLGQYLKYSLKTQVENYGKTDSKYHGIADYLLLLDLISANDLNSGYFNSMGSFEAAFSDIEQNITKDELAFLFTKIESILKGKYAIEDDHEKIEFDGGYVYLRDASSGQKESVRIMQDFVMALVFPEILLRVIEEPEAHLFPVAQKQLIELLVFLANAQTENQVIITTHSPYVLTTLNNLLFATRVVQKNPAAEEEVAKVAPAPFRIDPATFAAYSLGNSFDAEEPYCANIVDSELGMIQQNYLDTVSDLLGMEFDHLSKIHLRSFQRHGR